MAHGIMFHHFHSRDHNSRPGSISGDDLEAMIDFIERQFVILNPADFSEKAQRKTLTEKEVVLTFDDALLSQIDVALPVIQARGILGLFSVYSSVLAGRPDPLEIFAAFRNDVFRSFAEFWESFQAVVSETAPNALVELRSNYPAHYLGNFTFYSPEERKFRFLRDVVLGPERYQELMWEHVQSHPVFDVAATSSSLWMDKNSLTKLVSLGHSIGLHSDTHPTRMDLLPLEQQIVEYQSNFQWISDNLKVTPFAVAHPCGAYSSDTLQILTNMGITLGFRSSLTSGPYGTSLEIPREDHSNIYREMVS